MYLCACYIYVRVDLKEYKKHLRLCDKYQNNWVQFTSELFIKELTK